MHCCETSKAAAAVAPARPLGHLRFFGLASRFWGRDDAIAAAAGLQSTASSREI